MVSQRSKKASKYSYAERVLGALNEAQHDSRKRAVHLATLRAHVKKRAHVKEDPLGPQWSAWVGRTVHRLEEQGVLEHEGHGSVALSANAKKAIKTARRSLAFPEHAHATAEHHREDALWRRVSRDFDPDAPSALSVSSRACSGSRSMSRSPRKPRSPHKSMLSQSQQSRSTPTPPSKSTGGAQKRKKSRLSSVSQLNADDSDSELSELSDDEDDRPVIRTRQNKRARRSPVAFALRSQELPSTPVTRTRASDVFGETEDGADAHSVDANSALEVSSIVNGDMDLDQDADGSTEPNSRDTESPSFRRTFAMPATPSTIGDAQPLPLRRDMTFTIGDADDFPGNFGPSGTMSTLTEAPSRESIQDNSNSSHSTVLTGHVQKSKDKRSSTHSLARTQSNSLIDRVSKQPTPAPSEGEESATEASSTDHFGFDNLAERESLREAGINTSMSALLADKAAKSKLIASLLREKAALETERSALRATAEDHARTIAELSAAKSQLATSNEAQASTIASLRATNDSLRTDSGALADIRTTLAAADARITAELERAKRLEGTIGQRDGAIAEQKIHLERKEGIIAELRTRLMALETKNTALVAGVAERDERLAQQATAMQERDVLAAERTAVVQALETDVAELNKQLAAATAARAVLDEDHARSLVSIDELETTISSINMQNADFQSLLAETERAKTDETKRASELEAARDIALARVSELELTAEELRTRLHAENGRAEALVADVESKDISIAALRSEIENANIRLGELQDAAAEHLKTVESLEITLHTMGIEHDDAVAQHAEQVASLQAELGQTRTTLHGVSAEHDARTTELSQTTHELDTAVAELGSAQALLLEKDAVLSETNAFLVDANNSLADLRHQLGSANADLLSERERGKMLEQDLLDTTGRLQGAMADCDVLKQAKAQKDAVISRLRQGLEYVRKMQLESVAAMDEQITMADPSVAEQIDTVRSELSTPI